MHSMDRCYSQRKCFSMLVSSSDGILNVRMCVYRWRKSTFCRFYCRANACTPSCWQIMALGVLEVSIGTMVCAHGAAELRITVVFWPRSIGHLPKIDFAFWNKIPNKKRPNKRIFTKKKWSKTRKSLTKKDQNVAFPFSCDYSCFIHALHTTN